MVVGVQQAFSVTAASNASADSNINFAEGQTPASLNDAMRANMAAIKGFANQFSGAKTTGGSANAQTFTSDSVAAITTYAAGRGFVFKAGYSNSGAATLNVDGVGATAIRKGGAETALAANDIVANGIYFVVYNGTYWILLNPEGGSGAGFQPLDATLTALAALSWSSGNALVQFTAADTVSLTLAPSVSSVSASQGAAAATPTATLVNTTDNASCRVLRLEGDRATPANNDAIYQSWFLSDSGGTQTEFARFTAIANDITDTSEDGTFSWSLMKAGSLTTLLLLAGASSVLAPNTNDGLALGTTSLGFSDLHLATGGVINWANGLVTITHDSARDMLDVTAGSLRAKPPASSNTTGTMAAADANSIVTCTGNITLDDDIFAARDTTVFDPGTSARTFTRAAGLAMYVNGVDSASATLAANQLGTVYWRDTDTAILAGAFT